MQYAYEDRIAELRSKVDRTTSRQLLDQEQFDQKLDQIMKRQTALESRATALGSMPDAAITGSIKPPARGAAETSSAASGTPKPSPISDTVIFVAPPDREARLESRTTAVTRTAANPKGSGVEGSIVRLQSSLDRIEARQAASLNTIEESIDGKARRMRGVLADLGLDLGSAAMKPSSATPMGGPFVPVKLRADSSAFDRQLYRINVARAQAERLSRALV